MVKGLVDHRALTLAARPAPAETALQAAAAAATLATAAKVIPATTPVFPATAAFTAAAFATAALAAPAPVGAVTVAMATSATLGLMRPTLGAGLAAGRLTVGVGSGTFALSGRLGRARAGDLVPQPRKDFLQHERINRTWSPNRRALQTLISPSPRRSRSSIGPPPSVTQTLHLHTLSLRVADLQRSVDFYAGRLGFAVRSSGGRVARLGVDPTAPDCLVLEEHPGVRPADPGSTGLFHGALLLPDRRALGAWLGWTARRGTEFTGFADHGVSEALYLDDPDGNGLEVYADRPAAEWPRRGGELAMFTHPLDARALVAAGGRPGDQPLAGSCWGHLHLRVGNLAEAARFYQTELGVVVTQGSFPGACFLAADGYHHHVGLNVWGGPHRASAADEAGLAEARWKLAGGRPARRLTPEGFALVIEPIGGTP